MDAQHANDVGTRARRGLTVQMAMVPGQTRPGGCATTDNIPDVDYVRNNLAVTPDFKSEVSHVQTFHVPEGVQVQSGTVGRKSAAANCTREVAANYKY